MSLRILITGANRGLGLELTRQLHARSDDVLATCRHSEAANELAGLGVRGEPLDVNDPAHIARLVHGVDGMGDRPLDVLINNAGVGVGGPALGQLDYDQIMRFMATNALAPLRLIEALLGNLRLGARKLVVNVTSHMGSIGDNTSGSDYAYRASKAALNMFNKSLSIDLGGEGFTCIVVHPGWVQTSMGGGAAPVSVEDSACGIIELIDRVTPEDTGSFFDYTGALVPW